MPLSSPVRLALCILCLVSAFRAMTSQQNPPSHARVELIARQNSVTPGSTLQLGVHFLLEPGWHIYWINPGDSGQPPVFKWQLPAGFTTGEIEWPRPERMQSNSQLADYGYHDEALFIVPIHAPQLDSVHLGKLQFVAEIKWLICREVCIPEHAQLQLTLPVTAQAKQDPASEGLFASTEKLLPQPLPRGWRASAISTKNEFVLAVNAGKPVTKAQFFPLEPGQIDNPTPQKLQPSASGLKIILKKSDILLKPISVLHGVLAIAGGPAYRIDAPVHQSIQ